jgi:hypothetical protein
LKVYVLVFVFKPTYIIRRVLSCDKGVKECVFVNKFTSKFEANVLIVVVIWATWMVLTLGVS